MPYIKQRDRVELDHRNPSTAGELNYWFTTVCLTYLREKGESYQNFNDLIGALEGCKLELYRREIVPYEDKKIKENGDIDA